MSPSPRVMIIGLDGADHAAFRRWMDAGLLPTLAGLAERGRHGVLWSTFPPVTAPAWMSLVTGEQPGSHGLCGFFTPPEPEGRYVRSVASSLSVEAPFLWEIAAARGRSAAAVNVPLTYPLRPFDGVLVSGMLTPDGADFIHPPEWRDRLRKEYPDYRIDLLWQDYRDDPGALVRDQTEVTARRTDLCLTLLRDRAWDFFMVVFTGPDRIQHCLYDDVRTMDAPAAKRTPRASEVLRYFQDLDGQVAQLVEAAGDDAHVFIVSDHGFGPARRSVRFSRWLADRGWLALRDARTIRNRSRLKRWLNGVGIRRKHVAALAARLGLRAEAERAARSLNPAAGSVDWSRTRAYYVPSHGFCVNLRGREPSGCVDPADFEAVRAELMRELAELRDPETGERICPVVLPREEVFRGRNAEKMPDILIDFGDGPHEAFDHGHDGPFLEPSGFMNGTHRRPGLYIGCGPDLRRGSTEVEEIDIQDIAPNALHAMGLPIPRRMDGVFRPDLFRKTRSVAEYTDDDGGAGRSGSLSAQQQADLERQLKGLGYL